MRYLKYILLAFAFSIVSLNTQVQAQILVSQATQTNASAPGSTSNSPSFDCRKATTKVEKLICANPELSKLDVDLAELYKEAVSKERSVRDDQRAWNIEKNKCVDADCLKTAYEDRLSDLTNFIVRYDRAALNQGQAQAPTPAPGNVSPGAQSAPVAPRPAPSGGGEVGDKLFVSAPRAAPIHVSKGGTRYWACNGMVSPKLLDAIYQELTQFSKEEGVPPPSSDPCHYKIGTFNAMGNSITTYSVDFYINRSNMETCVSRDYCSDSRSMTLRLRDDAPHRQYMITHVSRKITRMACVAMSGQIVSLRGGC